MGTRIAVFAQPRTGTHFITRSLAGSASVPYCAEVRYGAAYDIPVRDPEWVIASHDLYTDEIAGRLADAGAKVIGVTRNPVDHVLSLIGSRGDFTDEDLLRAAESDWFLNMRLAMGHVPVEQRVSYDLLADSTNAGHQAELDRLASLTGLTSVTLEPAEVTRQALGPIQVAYAKPGRWKEVVSAGTAAAIAQALGEEVPE